MIPTPGQLCQITTDAQERTCSHRKNEFIRFASMRMKNAAESGKYSIVLESHSYVDMEELKECKTQFESIGYKVTPRSRCGDVIQISWIHHMPAK